MFKLIFIRNKSEPKTLFLLICFKSNVDEFGPKCLLIVLQVRFGALVVVLLLVSKNGKERNLIVEQFTIFFIHQMAAKPTDSFGDRALERSVVSQWIVADVKDDGEMDCVVRTQ